MRRKIVTILFCDVTGSTALGESLDPEALRAVLGRYFDRMKAIVERHDGTVEKFIGDAVMAVFGVPVAHEDDAFRAVRAAAEMREALPDLGVQARIGVNTGEVVTGTDERLVTGDAVNVAARLEQVAQPGEILLGAMTLALARDSLEVEDLDPVTLKGKAQPVTAYRLVRAREARPRRYEMPFVGRARELGALREGWERALAERRCELVTVLAEAGVGKSRLVDEALAQLEVAVVRGRCLPYGEGISYWPVIEVLRQLAVQPSDEAAAAAVRSLLGESDAPASAEDIAWGVRKTFEQAAAHRPLAVVFDDVHWGEDAFLDLVEHVALLASGAPIALACIARPELLERRPQWPVTLRLEPLPPDDVEALIPRQIGGGRRAQITRAAGGNPLFISEMLAMAGDADPEVAVPPTLQALLAARLDKLDPAERRILERGSVEGEIFHRGSVQALTPEEPQVTPRLAALVRRDLIRPDVPQIPGDDGFRFRHLLLRDAAYIALPKTTRAELHERFALWLEERAHGHIEMDEILGYHFEQAWRYHRELGLPTAEAVTGRARKRLANAGRRALVRQDHSAALNLLERAAAVHHGDDIALTVDLADALFFSARLEDAFRTLSAVAERAARAGDRTTELVARVKETQLRMDVTPEGIADELESLVAAALPVLEASDDDFGLSVAYYARSVAAHQRGRIEAELTALERSIAHARRGGLPSYGGWTLLTMATSRFRGPWPVSKLLAWLDEQARSGIRNPYLPAFRAIALAMLGRFEEGRALLTSVRTDLADRGAKLQLAVATAQVGVELELLAGNPAAAAALGEKGCRLLEQAGERSFLSTAAGYLAQALYALGDLKAAQDRAASAAELGASDDALTQTLSRQVLAKVLASRGRHAEAEEVAREAIALADGTDLLNVQADAYSDLADVLALGGNGEQARTALGQAFARYERKGNIVMAERTRARLVEP
ncbi:MAG: adenylate/guanylate cyclase domain-containing protein [Solirubrobacteraceae bacterium]